jgi:phenylacetate-CoA ligase
MLIIRGVNVFPSQIESVLLKEKDIALQYHICVDRINNLDTMDIDIELAEGVAFDEVKNVEALKKRLTAEINSAIGVGANIHLVSSGSIRRSEGKAVRVTDKRKL